MPWLRERIYISIECPALAKLLPGLPGKTQIMKFFILPAEDLFVLFTPSKTAGIQGWFAVMHAVLSLFFVGG